MRADRVPARGRLSPLASAAIVLALLFAQTLGLAHRTLHGNVSHHQPVPAALFEGHDDASPVCQLYDQLAHGDLLFAALPESAAVAPALANAPAVAPSLRVVSATHFLARAPPRG